MNKLVYSDLNQKRKICKICKKEITKDYFVVIPNEGSELENRSRFCIECVPDDLWVEYYKVAMVKLLGK